jgi:benzoate/toluate 1,2-dioxygenase reductase subunit
MSAVPVTLLFADGVTKKLDVPAGEKIIDVASACGMSLLTDCASGICGTCTGQMVCGSVDLDDYDSAVLPHDERANGAILTCVSRARESCVIELPYDSTEIGGDELPPQVGAVVSADLVAEETLRLEVQVPQALTFLPGQYVRMRPAGSNEWRSYSMANESGQSRLVFYIRLVEGGQFSTWLSAQAKPGATVEISPPRGSFFLREEQRPRLFVAGGTGLAPFLAMLKRLAADGAERIVPTRLLVGVRTGRHLFATEELRQLQQRLQGLTIDYAAECDADHGCHSGYATDLITQINLDPSTRVYLCGPPPMVDAAQQSLATVGIPKNEVLCERFA